MAFLLAEGVLKAGKRGDISAWLSSLGRYRVKLDFSREDAEQGHNYQWIRQAKPYAGET